VKRGSPKAYPVGTNVHIRVQSLSNA